MAVVCPGCAREYDVTLFPFGRTLWCTCGSRVGLARLEGRADASEPRFIADAMLGRLARWLRLLGFDCVWEHDIPDELLIRRALQEGRIVLTRDRALSEEWRVSDVYQVGGEKVRDQLAEVLEAFGLAARIRMLSRCSECNVPLARVDVEQVAARVPQRILERHDAFAACPRCGRAYWEGSHAARIRRFVEALLARRERAGADLLP